LQLDRIAVVCANKNGDLMVAVVKVASYYIFPPYRRCSLLFLPMAGLESPQVALDGS
jgi:hypothetical protein